MGWLRKKITDLQNRPFRTKMKILRWSVIVAALILILFWIATLRFRNLQTGEGAFGKFGEILDNLKQFKFYEDS